MTLTYVLGTFVYPVLKIIAILVIGFTLANISRTAIAKLLGLSCLSGLPRHSGCSFGYFFRRIVRRKSLNF